MKTMIYLEEKTHARLKHIAVDEWVSMAELIRRAVDQFLKEYSPKKAARKRGALT